MNPRNTARSLFVCDGVAKVVALLTLTIAARHLGPENFGIYSTVFAQVGLLSILLELASPAYFLRESLRDGSTGTLFSQFLQLRLIIAVCVAAGLTLWLLLSEPPADFRHAGLLAAIWLLSLAMQPEWLFQSQQRLDWVSNYRIALALVGLAATVACILTRISVAGFVFSRALFEATLACFVCVLLLRRFRTAPLRFDLDRCRLHASRNGWFFAASIATGVYASNTDIILLGHLGEPSEVGFYSAAQRIYLSAILPLKILVFSSQRTLFAARFHDTATSSSDDLERISKGIVATAGLLAILLQLGGPVAIRFLFGKDYGESGDLIRTLSFAVLLVGMGAVIPQVLVGLNRVKRASFCYISAAIVSITVNLILIPRIGAPGSAIAVVAAEATLVFVSLGLASPCVPKIVRRTSVFSRPGGVALLVLGSNFALLECTPSGGQSAAEIAAWCISIPVVIWLARGLWGSRVRENQSPA